MKIYAFHLLNDFSGSPKVLGQLANGWVEQGLEVHLACSPQGSGFLSDLKGVTYHNAPYKFVSNRFFRMVRLVMSQLWLVCSLLLKVRREDIIYINTVLPFGAAVLGKMKGCRVIWHIHETSIRPMWLKRFLFGMVRWAASDVVYVSEFLSREESIETAQTHILPNALDQSFLEEARHNLVPSNEMKNVLMVCSLKAYKGVHEFVELASTRENLNFRLVLNASEGDVTEFFSETPRPENLELFPVQINLHPFYQWADVLLNLSRPDEWVETFGLTAIEGMAYGLPCIVPPTGGIADLVEEGENGFHADSRNMEALLASLDALAKDNELYQKMGEEALARADLYSESTFRQRSSSIVLEKTGYRNRIPKSGNNSSTNPRQSPV